jgi:SAM-dependent methyltransferase
MTARWLWLRASGGLDAAYAGDFWEFHSAGDWKGFASLLRRYCEPVSVVDVGCGDAKLLAAMRDQAPGLRVLGIDSSPVGLERAAAAGVAVEQHNLASLARRNLTALRATLEGFDVILSFETAEHLPQWAARAFVTSLARGRLVVFSAAHPRQGGTLHLNEQPPRYWQRLFAARGYHTVAWQETLRDELRQLDLPWWYGQNLQVFSRIR